MPALVQWTVLARGVGGRTARRHVVVVVGHGRIWSVFRLRMVERRVLVMQLTTRLSQSHAILSSVPSIVLENGDHGPGVLWAVAMATSLERSRLPRQLHMAAARAMLVLERLS